MLWSVPLWEGELQPGQALGWEPQDTQCPRSVLCSLEQYALLMPENSQKSRGEEGCKFLGCNVVKYFIEERHGKCVLLGKRPSGGAIAGLQQRKYEPLFFFFLTKI